MSSRTQVARYIAQELTNSDASKRAELMSQTASWLKKHNQVKAIDHLVQDIALALADTGYIFATVTTAHELTLLQRTQVEGFVAESFSANHVEAVYKIDKSLIGGIKIETPEGTLDDSVQGKLNRMLENIG